MESRPEWSEVGRTRRFYLVLLGLIAVVALVCATVLAADDRNADVAPVATIGGAAVGALASLSRRDA